MAISTNPERYWNMCGFLTDEEIPIEKIEQFLTDHEDDLRKSSMEHIKKINLINKS